MLDLKHGKAKIAADISAVGFRHNPHKASKASLESNPYAVLALPDGRKAVADAAGNDLVVVSPGGRARPLTVFPNHDGNEAAKPTARVWKVGPRTGRILGWKSGFGSIGGPPSTTSFNDKGDLYVSRLFAGQVTKVSHGTRTSVKVPFPAGVAVDPYDGKVHVSAWSIADRDGTRLGGGRKTPGGRLWKILGF